MPITPYRFVAAEAELQPVNGGLAVPVDVEIPPPPPDTSWETMRDEVMSSHSLAPADAWYAAHTGIGSPDIITGLPPGYSDPGPLTPADLVDGSLASTHDGQVFIGVRGTNIRVAHNNVTYVRCWVTGMAGPYAAAYYPTAGSGLGGLRIEASTFAYARNYSDYPDGGMILRDPAWWNGRGLPGGITYSTIMRRCRCYNWTGGVGGWQMLLEYNYINNPQYGQGAHINQWRVHGTGRAYRNYGAGGNSGVGSIYFDNNPVNDVSYEQNFMNGAYRGTTVLPQAHVNLKSGPYVAPATGIVLRDNYHGPLHQATNPLSLEPIRWGEDGNILGPNHYISTGEAFYDSGPN